MNIKKFREAANLKQLDLAQALGISVVTMSRYENNVRQPRANELLKMAQLFGCTVDDLLGKDIEQPKEQPTAEETTED